MNAYIFILALLSKAVAFEKPQEHCDVGTVLFPRTALSQQTWTLPQIGLLRARKHFLDLIPPVHVLNTRSEDFSDSILAYFKETFEVVNREAPDRETNTLMKLALSDTIGGYLKMWILPITKFAYYGGSVPKQNALKLYDLHDDIKKYLNTDGKGWHNPKSSFLYSMSVNIAPIRQEHTRKSGDPCDDIAYFEKTTTGLAIPVPSISWVEGSECMFLPLKNQGPVPLSLPSSSSMLFRYYNTAKHCIASSSIEEMDSYEERLQRWLDQNVVPHLNDDKIYPALHSVLSLVNKSRTLFDMSENTLYAQKLHNRTCIAGIPIDLSSKKMMIITVIIFLEIAWCIPTLCYLMCTKMKKKKMKSSTTCYHVKPYKSDGDKHGGWNCSACTTTNGTKFASKLVSASPSTQSQACLSNVTKNYDAKVAANFPKASDHSIGTATHSEFTCQLHPLQVDVRDQAVNKMSSSHFHGPVATSSTPATVAVSTDKFHVTRPLWKRSVYSSTPSKVSLTSCIAPLKTTKNVSSVFRSCKCDCKSASSSYIMKSCSCDCKNLPASMAKLAKCCRRDCDSTSYIKSKGSKKATIQDIKTYRCDPKKTSSSFIKTSCCDSNCECFNSIPEEELLSASGSLITVQDLQPTQTVTLLHDTVSSVNRHETSRELESHSLSASRRSKKSVKICDLASSPLMFDRKSCKEMQSLAVEKASKQTMKYPIPKAKASKQTSVDNAAKGSKKDPRASTGKALLEITIDRQRLRCKPPPTTPTPSPPTSDTPTKTAKPKPSKIPKRFFTSCVTQTLFPTKKLESSRKSLIPQPKRQLTVDDIVIKNYKPASECNKLNVTL